MRCYHQGQLTRIINPWRMMFSAPYNGLLRSVQVTGHRRFNRVNYPFVKILIALAQASGEDMILTTIQLLWITLITRMLLLIPLARLLIKTTLIALARETRIRSVTTITRTVRAGS